jgi:hypothetical protein
VPLGLAYQPVPPPGTVAAAHRSASSSPPLFGRPRGMATPHSGPSLFPVPTLHAASTPGPPSPASPASAQTRAVRCHRALLSFSLPRPSPHTAERATSRPRQRLSHRGPPRRVFDHRRRRFPPSTVRPANPPPFLDLEPPSPPSSSPIAPGASRSRR